MRADWVQYCDLVEELPALLPPIQCWLVAVYQSNKNSNFLQTPFVASLIILPDNSVSVFQMALTAGKGLGRNTHAEKTSDSDLSCILKLPQTSNKPSLPSFNLASLFFTILNSVFFFRSNQENHYLLLKVTVKAGEMLGWRDGCCSAAGSTEKILKFFPWTWIIKTGTWLVIFQFLYWKLHSRLSDDWGLGFAGSRMLLSWCELYLSVKLIVIYIAILHTVIN